MGLADIFKDENVEIKVGKLYELLKEAARAELFRNGVKNKVPYNHILEVMDGNADALVKDEPIWHDAKADPPKKEGLYCIKKDGGNQTYTAVYLFGEWWKSLDFEADNKIILVKKWSEYPGAKSED